jgi:hypothetical protein
MVTDKQVRRLFEMRNKYEHKYKAADAAGISVKTARKYLRSGKLPSQCKPEHTWRTREDPFATDWVYIEKMLLESGSSLQVKSIFEHLQFEHSGRYSNGQLRTLQRRVKVWKALKGPSKEVFFPQNYSPAQWSCSDFTSMNKLGITISGQLFKHLVYHFVLCYSNWQSCRVCYSESFESLSLGIQDALWRLGGVPFYHRSDNLTSAVNKVGNPDVFTAGYRALAGHYGFKAVKTNIRSPHENGDVEKSNDLFKKAVGQHLLLRSSHDFDNFEQYEQFLQDIITGMNKNCSERLLQEIEQLKPLPSLRYDDYRTKVCRVGKTGTIRILHNTYSVHSRLIGENINVRIYADKLEIWYAQHHIETLCRLRGENAHHINYRHIIDRLVRKPGAFDNYRYKDDLYPSSIFRIAYDILSDSLTVKQASKEYLKILNLAAKEGESLVNEALRYQIDTEDTINFEKTKLLIEKEQTPPKPTDVYIGFTDIRSYDNLLTAGSYV